MTRLTTDFETLVPLSTSANVASMSRVDIPCTVLRKKSIQRYAIFFLRITTKLLIFGLFQKGRVLAQDGMRHHSELWETLHSAGSDEPRPPARAHRNSREVTTP